MSVKSGQALTVLFTTSHPTTGAATDADSLPAGTLYVDGTADAATVTVTKLATGTYKAAVTCPTLTAGQVVALIATATVNSVAGAGKVFEDTADTKLTSDLNDFDPANDTVAHVTLVDTTTTNTDMRGTDGANTTAPDNAGIAAVKAKTDSLTFTTPGKVDATVDTSDLADKDDVASITAAIAALPTSTTGTLINQDTRIDDDGNIVASPLWTALGVATAGSSITAYLATDTGYSTPIRTTIAATDGTWALYLPDGNYTLVVALDGHYDGTEGDSVITRSVIVA